jgi:hypothetical protein
VRLHAELHSHDCQRASRKLRVHAVGLCASFPPLYCLGAKRGDRGVRYARTIIIKCFKTRPRAKGGRGVRYARKITNAHHVS